MDFMPGHQMLQNTSREPTLHPPFPHPPSLLPSSSPAFPSFSLQLTTIYHLARSFPLDYLINICFIG